MGRNFKIITKDNFDFLVTKDVENYYAYLNYAVPRKTKKGYLGMKHKYEELRTKNKEEAIRQYANWKEDYVPKFHRKEIVFLYILYSPVTTYHTTCPKCNKQAQILTSIVMFTMSPEKAEEVHYIICKHCGNDEFPFGNKVGECHVNLMGREEKEKEIKLTFNNAQVKWEDWMKSK